MADFNRYLLSAGIQLGIGVVITVVNSPRKTTPLNVNMEASKQPGYQASLAVQSRKLVRIGSAAFTLVELLVVIAVIAILAGLLLSFTFSFEDFIIAFFVAGPDVTLPIYVFSSIRRGITPEINAVGTVVLLSSFALLIMAQFLLRAPDRRRPAAD